MTSTPARTTEFSLLLVATLVTVAAYALASLGETASLPGNLLPFLGTVLGLLVIAHFAVRRFAPTADPTILPVVGLLNGVGYAVIARLDPDLASRQAMWTAVAVLAFVGTLAAVRRATDLERYRYIVALAGIGLLLLPLAPGIGTSKNGARLWVEIGPLSFQPGEIAKLALAIFFASYLVERRELLAPGGLPASALAARARAMGPLLAAWALSLVVMIAERDLGSSTLFFALFVGMLWLAAGGAFWPMLGGSLFAMGSLLAWAMFNHVQERVSTWLSPWDDASGAGFQLVQAIFAFAAGGMVGVGLAKGRPDRIPAATTDLIFAAIGEELGLIGGAAVIAAFMLLVAAGLRIAMRASRPFDQLLAAGLTLIIGVQSFLIIGGVTRVLPLTGITLPFVSYGGSSLVANWILVAILLRISATSLPKAREIAARPAQAAA